MQHSNSAYADGHSVFGPACLESGGVECIDHSSSFRCEGGMLFDGVWMISINPEDRMVKTVADAVNPRSIGHLHHTAHANRPQSGVIEGGGTTDVCDPNAGVVRARMTMSALPTIATGQRTWLEVIVCL
jgi:hypothetical protein